MTTEHPTVGAVLDAYDAVAARHDQAAELHAQAYADAAPKPEAGVSAYDPEAGPSDE